MRAALLTVGDELLVGQVVDTNAAFLGDALTSLGFDLIAADTVGDDEPRLVAALGRLLGEAQVVVVTGGLGPTHDDVTKSAICRFVGVDLVSDADALANIRARVARRGRTATAVQEAMALVPRGARVLQNANGSAPGTWLDRPDGRVLISLPGVPHEMRGLVADHLVPMLTGRAGRFIGRRTLITTGIGESDLAERFGPTDTFLGPTDKLAFLPAITGVRLRITATDTDAESVAARLDRIEAHLRDAAGAFIHGDGDEPLEVTVGRLLTERGLTLSVAESCTGGWVAHRLSRVPGASDYLVAGLVTYADRTKVQLLGIPAVRIDEHGAVSPEIAVAMAEGVRRELATDLGLSTTGIAGPGGGTDEKPVGLVHLALADAAGTVTVELQLTDDRTRNQDRATEAALDLVRRRLLGLETAR